MTTTTMMATVDLPSSSPLLLPSEPPAMVGVGVVGTEVGVEVGRRVSHSRSEVGVGAARSSNPAFASHGAVNCLQMVMEAS